MRTLREVLVLLALFGVFAFVAFIPAILKRAALILAVFCAACGGGSSPVTPNGGPVIPAAPWRAGVFMSYYGGCPSFTAAPAALCFTETRGHTNLAWVWGWGDGAWATNATEQLTLARMNGYSAAVIGLPGCGLASEMRFALDTLHGAIVSGKTLLDWDTLAFYWIDEPDGEGGGCGSRSDAQIRATNNLLREMASDYPEIRKANIAVIYSPKDTPAIDTYDWVGFDDYDRGAFIFSNGQYAMLKAKLRPDQRILLVPGGDCPWKQDPAKFLNTALADAQVIAVVAFKWFGDKGGCGIRNNSIRPLYEAAGKFLIG